MREAADLSALYSDRQRLLSLAVVRTERNRRIDPHPAKPGSGAGSSFSGTYAVIFRITEILPVTGSIKSRITVSEFMIGRSPPVLAESIVFLFFVVVNAEMLDILLYF